MHYAGGGGSRMTPDPQNRHYVINRSSLRATRRTWLDPDFTLIPLNFPWRFGPNCFRFFENVDYSIQKMFQLKSQHLRSPTTLQNRQVAWNWIYLSCVTTWRVKIPILGVTQTCYDWHSCCCEVWCSSNWTTPVNSVVIHCCPCLQRF